MTKRFLVVIFQANVSPRAALDLFETLLQCSAATHSSNGKTDALTSVITILRVARKVMKVTMDTDVMLAMIKSVPKMVVSFTERRNQPMVRVAPKNFKFPLKPGQGGQGRISHKSHIATADFRPEG